MPVAAEITRACPITARRDRLPTPRHVWTLVTLIALGATFEDLFFTGPVAPDLFAEKIFTPTTTSLFGMTGLASFVPHCSSARSPSPHRLHLFAAVVQPLHAGPRVPGYCRRRQPLTHDQRHRRRAGDDRQLHLGTRAQIEARQGLRLSAEDRLSGSAAGGAVRWLLVPRSPLPLSGWRWVIIIGAIGAVLIWIIRWRPPEAPRRLAQHERLADAERVVGAIEARVAAEYGKRLPPPAPPAPEQPGQGRNLEAFAPDYLNRTIMKVVVSFGSMIGCYGFANRVPTLLRHPRH